MGKVLFSKVSVCRGGGGRRSVHRLHPIILPSTGPMSFTGGTPVTGPMSIPGGGGLPHPGTMEVTSIQS